MRIQVDNLRKRYFGGWALDRLSMTIDEGQTIVLLGPNGAGKTTLLRCLAGMVVPDEGEILFDDEAVARDSVEQRRRFHFLPDFPTLYPMCSVARNLGILLHLYERDGPGMSDRVVELLKEFDIHHLARRAMSQLSRGEEYKASLVGLIAADPEVWLLDEPFASGMDPHGISAFKEHVTAATRRGRTVIYSTQILEVAERFSDRVCVIHRGKVEAFAPVRDLHGEMEGENLNRLFARLREREDAATEDSNPTR